MKFGTHNSSWLDSPDTAEAFEAARRESCGKAKHPEPGQQQCPGCRCRDGSRGCGKTNGKLAVFRPCYARCKGRRREEVEIFGWLQEARKERIGKSSPRDGIPKPMHGQLRRLDPDQVVYREELVSRYGSPGRL